MRNIVTSNANSQGFQVSHCFQTDVHASEGTLSVMQVLI